MLVVTIGNCYYPFFFITSLIISPSYFVSECHLPLSKPNSHWQPITHSVKTEESKKSLALSFFKCKSNGAPHAHVTLWERFEWHWRGLSMEDPSGSPCMIDSWVDRTVLSSHPFDYPVDNSTHRAKGVNSQGTQLGSELRGRLIAQTDLSIALRSTTGWLRFLISIINILQSNRKILLDTCAILQERHKRNGKTGPLYYTYISVIMYACHFLTQLKIFD